MQIVNGLIEITIDPGSGVDGALMLISNHYFDLAFTTGIVSVKGNTSTFFQPSKLMVS